MSKDSILKFKDFEYEFGMFTKVIWNGEVIYDEKDALEGECKRVDEVYGDRLVYEMNVNVVDFHHVELDIIGETFEHTQLITKCEKQYKEVQRYIEEQKWNYSNIGIFMQVDLGKKFETTFSSDYFTPSLDLEYNREGNILITPYIVSHTKYVEEDEETPIYSDVLKVQLSCYNYALEEAMKIKDKFNLVVIDEENELK